MDYSCFLCIHDRLPTFGSSSSFGIEKYDRSGRSTGVAIITYETAEEARNAQGQFDGILAKGNVLSSCVLLPSVALHTSYPLHHYFFLFLS